MAGIDGDRIADPTTSGRSNMSGTTSPQPSGRRAAKRLSPAELRARWHELTRESAASSSLLPGEPLGKCDLNVDGSLEWPATNQRSGLSRAFIAGELRRLLPPGVAFTLCPIETGPGIRTVDVAWASAEFAARHGTATPLTRAPELCIELGIGSDWAAWYRQRAAAFLAAGAEEVWLVDETGKIEIVAREGTRERSAFGIRLDIGAGPRTPGLEARHAKLAALSSRRIDVDKLPWTPTPLPGVAIKVLMEDPETGLLTTLTRMAPGAELPLPAGLLVAFTRMSPGAELPLDEHLAFEQSWVLEGRLVDDEGEVTAGNYVWRPEGSTHVVRAPEGCLVLGFFFRSDRFE
jgi:hypothetical protein